MSEIVAQKRKNDSADYPPNIISHQNLASSLPRVTLPSFSQSDFMQASKRLQKDPSPPLRMPQQAQQQLPPFISHPHQTVHPYHHYPLPTVKINPTNFLRGTGPSAPLSAPYLPPQPVGGLTTVGLQVDDTYEKQLEKQKMIKHLKQQPNHHQPIAYPSVGFPHGPIGPSVPSSASISSNFHGTQVDNINTMGVNSGSWPPHPVLGTIHEDSYSFNTSIHTDNSSTPSKEGDPDEQILDETVELKPLYELNEDPLRSLNNNHGPMPLRSVPSSSSSSSTIHRASMRESSSHANTNHRPADDVAHSHLDCHSSRPVGVDAYNLNNPISSLQPNEVKRDSGAGGAQPLNEAGTLESVLVYDHSIYEAMRQAEVEFLSLLPLAGHVTPVMRAILVDWLVEVQTSFGLHEETLFLAVSILNRYLCVEPVAKQKLQLIGAVAILVAAKLAEVNPPEIQQMMYICADTYRRQEVLDAEKSVLLALEFKLYAPVSIDFLTVYYRVAQISDKTCLLLGQFLLELILQEYAFRSHPGSLLAAAALDLSHLALKNTRGWNEFMSKEFGYTLSEVHAVARMLNEVALMKPFSLLNCREKYAQPAYQCVSTIILKNYYL